MVNGKRGDHPYTDIVAYGEDLSAPEIATLVRELDSMGDERIRAIVSDLLMLILPLPNDWYWRERLLGHLGTLRELAVARSENSED